MLKVDNINVFYGVIHAIKNVSLEVKEGEIVSLIGANGAGKPSTLQAISGMLKPKSGSVSFMGEDLNKVESYDILKMGMAHVPEGRRVFAGMSVKENLEMGAYTRKDQNEINDNLERVFMRFPRLLERKKQLAGTLSGGEQQRVAIARSLATGAGILLADEPTGNLDGENSRNVVEILTRLAHEEGYCVIIVTHDPAIAEASDVVYHMTDGILLQQVI